MTTLLLPPTGDVPPLCACGCGVPVRWGTYKGWARYLKGHAARGKPGTRLGATANAETSRKQSESLRRYHAGKRQRDLDPTGPGVYSTFEYREARAALVVGKPCQRCGAAERIHAHHVIPGDDASLIPLCSRCHVIEHHELPGAKGRQPPPGAIAPLCRCGCGGMVKWKRVRGWAQFCRGHGNAKIPAVRSKQEAPACGCGCGEPTKWRFGKGWNKYRRGHEQRVIGHYRSRV